MVLQSIEDELRNTIRKMIQMVVDSFDKLKVETEKRRNTLQTFEQMKKISKNDTSNEHIKELVEIYKLTKRDYSRSFKDQFREHCLHFSGRKLLLSLRR